VLNDAKDFCNNIRHERPFVPDPSNRWDGQDCKLTTVVTVIVQATVLILATLISGQSFSQQARKTEIKVGFVPGPYIDEFKAGVEPELKKLDYSVRYFEFSTGLEANNSVFKGDIDAKRAAVLTPLKNSHEISKPTKITKPNRLTK
jgi:ABC-type nitrate/sulfonate/bicarbonate transport system substrate-binding protein